MYLIPWYIFIFNFYFWNRKVFIKDLFSKLNFYKAMLVILLIIELSRLRHIALLKYDSYYIMRIN